MKGMIIVIRTGVMQASIAKGFSGGADMRNKRSEISGYAALNCRIQYKKSEIMRRVFLDLKDILAFDFYKISPVLILALFSMEDANAQNVYPGYVGDIYLNPPSFATKQEAGDHTCYQATKDDTWNGVYPFAGQWVGHSHPSGGTESHWAINCYRLNPDGTKAWRWVSTAYSKYSIAKMCSPTHRALDTKGSCPNDPPITECTTRSTAPNLHCPGPVVPSSQKNNGYSCKANSPKLINNPINSGSGNKLQIETDFTAGPASPLALKRTYSHFAYDISEIGRNWRIHPYFKSRTSTKIAVVRPDLRVVEFNLVDSEWKPDADIHATLVRIAPDTSTGAVWKYVALEEEGGKIELYDSAGKLIGIVYIETGRSLNFQYSDDTVGPNGGYFLDTDGNLTATPLPPGYLIRVADQHGRHIKLGWGKNDKVVKHTLPDGLAVHYRYDVLQNLASVTYPDNRKRIYHYNEQEHTAGTHLPNALTGITDENGKRYATYKYNNQGQAISTEYVGDANRATLQYGANSTSVKDPLDTVRTYHFTTILGTIRPTGQSQPGGSGCGPAASAITYDGHGNVESRADFNGVRTAYFYDLARNLETRRVEAADSPKSRTITTEWHPNWRLVAHVAEPLRFTTFVYNGQPYAGNNGALASCAPSSALVDGKPIAVLCKKVEQATQDANGSQGFAAATAGASRTTSYTYNQYGQVLTITGPRTDIQDVTTYTYDGMGNLVSITNAAGHVTTLSEYDANGRAGRIVDPNGLVTELGYSPRGWLTVRKVGNETTTYDYDGVGQLIKATHPDGSHVAYAYDDAHRLTAIADSAGNRIDYTLDAIGNRIKEEVKDPQGQLARQTTRVYDALNRLQHVTGGM